MAQKYARRTYFVHLRNVKRLPPPPAAAAAPIAPSVGGDTLTSCPPAPISPAFPPSASVSSPPLRYSPNPLCSFVESDHLEGEVDMYSIVRTFTREAARRREAAEPDAACRLPWRPDHGHRMMHDLEGEGGGGGVQGEVSGCVAGGGAGVGLEDGSGHVSVCAVRVPRRTNPGYTAIGRLRGMAEIRGLMHAVLRADAEARRTEAEAGQDWEGARKKPRGEGGW